ncbi:hypothetical protein [Halobacterium zhouii]|uniref:hypothetical protein n=1 Tax=Halobacterium zhouii TaxID=2902624 RepID=UPI001E4EF9A1|nr:hypothetical protein [Halobacterium zhouii]
MNGDDPERAFVSLLEEHYQGDEEGVPDNFWCTRLGRTIAAERDFEWVIDDE